jgi:DNA polymerase-1
MKHLNLIDGSGYIYRAFYGLPPMKSPFGTPVNAAYGFVSMLTKLLIDSPADYFLILFDAKRHNWRNEIYSEYKANRLETPEDLKSQFPIIFEAAESFNIANVLEEGFEADDLIASYAKKAASEGFKVTIVSSDKDLMQLVGGNIYLYDPMKQKSIFEKEVFEKFGVYPDKVIDVQSLAGDSSDNIPGVPGIGIKTAAELINAYESLDNLLDKAIEIKQPKRKEALITYKEQALLSRELVTLKTNAPLRENFDEMLFKCAPKEELFAFLDKYGFKSLYSKAERLACKNGNGQNLIPQNKEPLYELITDKNSLQKWIDKAYEQGGLAIDTETTGLNQLQDKLVGISLAVKEGQACYIPLRHTGKEGAQATLFGPEGVQKDSLNQIYTSEALKMLKPLLKDKGVLKVGHNIKYDMHILTNEREDLEIIPFDDTMVLSYSLDGNLHSHGMDILALDFLGHNTIKFEDVCGTGKNKLKFNEVEIEKAKDYAAEDADITLRLHKLFKNRMLSEKMSYVYEELDRPLINILYKMERSGFCLDTKRLQKLSLEFGEQMQVLESQIFQISGESFNLSSPKQLGNILFEKMGISGGKKTKTGDWQTGADILEELSVDGNKFASLILEWRGLQKLKSTYTDALLTGINPKTGRVHTNFSQTITSTGRLSSSDPNLQNIPIKTENGKKIRECFIAKKGIS